MFLGLRATRIDNPQLRTRLLLMTQGIYSSFWCLYRKLLTQISLAEGGVVVIIWGKVDLWQVGFPGIHHLVWLWILGSNLRCLFLKLSPLCYPVYHPSLIRKAFEWQLFHCLWTFEEHISIFEIFSGSSSQNAVGSFDRAELLKKAPQSVIIKLLR